jgi:glycosyltransferase involved in cell wall biosynthesis
MYNEEANAENIISKAEILFEQLGLDYEIIIIESGSTDKTWEKVNEIIKNKKNIFAFHQETREGMGSALRLGYTKCSKDLICHLEADSPFDLTCFKKAIPILYENDCVIGYRIGRKEQNFKWSYYNISKHGAFLRQAYHIGYNLLLRVLFGLTVKDVNFSFKIFKREHVQKLHLISNGWFIDAELILELRKKGILPIEMPVEYKDRTAGNSTVSFLSPFYILYEMFKYIRYQRNKSPEQ